MPNEATFPTVLARILAEDGRRQDWLAGQIGVHASRVSRWVNGEGYAPGPVNRKKIAAALGRNETDVFFSDQRPASTGQRTAA